MKIRSLTFPICLIITALLLSLSSCNKDPNPFVDHEEDITIVYGLINPVDTIHYVRIQKAFLTEGDAYEMATDEQANIYLDSLSVRVFVTEENGSTPISNMDWMLEKVFVHKTDTLGDFDWEDVSYPVFRFIHQFDLSAIEDKNIHLEITNIVTGKKIYGESSMMNAISIRQPSGVNVPPESTTYQFGMSYTATSAKIEIMPTAYIKRYDVYMTFVYQEYDITTNASTMDTLLWDFGSINYDMDPYNVPVNPSALTIYYNPSAFFPWLESRIPVKENVVRVPRNFNFYFWGCSPEMNTYLEVNTSQTGIIQDRPEYTNLSSSTGKEDVYGIFTCRYARINENLRVSPATSADLQNYLGSLNFRTTYP